MKARIIPKVGEIDDKTWRSIASRFRKLIDDDKLYSNKQVTVLKVYPHEDPDTKERGYVFQGAFNPDPANSDAKLLVFSVALPVLEMTVDNCQEVFSRELDAQIPKLEEEYQRVVIDANSEVSDDKPE